MAVKVIAFMLAMLASAAPLSSSSSGLCISADFSLAMMVDGTFVSLTAIDSGRNGTLNIVGEKLARYPGTPVSRKGSSGNATLSFNIDAGDDCETTQTGQFGLFVPDLGERYGAQSPITATKGQAWPHFYVTNGQVEPQRTAASQLWYACNITVQGQDYYGLSWGVYNSNGSSPYGCEPTSVKQVFNIPC